MDRYWKEAHKILDENLKQTQEEIVRLNEKQNKNGFGIRALITMIFTACSVFTRYLNSRQWIYWNKLAGIHISNDGMVNDTIKRSSSLTNNHDENDERNVSVATQSKITSIFKMLSSLLKLDGDNSLIRWMKLILTSVWSVVLLAIGWKMLK